MIDAGPTSRRRGKGMAGWSATAYLPIAAAKPAVAVTSQRRLGDTIAETSVVRALLCAELGEVGVDVGELLVGDGVGGVLLDCLQRHATRHIDLFVGDQF